MIPKPGTDAHAERPGFIETTRVSGSRQGDTMNELIEKLKDNDAHRIFADMTDDERECMVKVGYKNCQVLTEYMSWRDISYPGGRLMGNSVYRIKSNYQPEPEYVDYPVATFESGGERWLGIFRGTVNAWTHLHCLPSLPGFRGFLDANGGTLQITWIAERISRGQKVIARFDK